MKSRLALLTLVATTLGCGDNAPMEPIVAEPQFGVTAGASGCYAVEFESHALGVFPSFSGTLSGDLTGASQVTFDFAELRFDGRTIKNAGTNTWHVDGGIVPELVGTTFEMGLETMNITTPGSNMVVGRLRPMGDSPALSNLTFKGTFNADNSGPPFAVDLSYRGVICP